MLMLTDPLRELDRLTQQVLGTATRPAVMPMCAWRDGDEFAVEFDLPEVTLKTSSSMLSERTDREGRATSRSVQPENCSWETTWAHTGCRPSMDAGMLRLTIPIAEKAKPHKIEIYSRRHSKAVKSWPRASSSQASLHYAVGATRAQRTPVAPTAARIEHQESSHDSCGVPRATPRRG
jgi:HSP20 family protein